MDEITTSFLNLLQEYQKGNISWQPSLQVFADLVFENTDILRRCIQQYDLTFEAHNSWDNCGINKDTFFNELKLLIQKHQNTPQTSSVSKKERDTNCEKLPSRFDLRDVNGKNYVTPVKNQGFYQGCAAFGITAMMESSLRYQLDIPVNGDQSGILPELSAQQLLFYAKESALKEKIEIGEFKDSLDPKIFIILEYCRQIGVVPDALYPYNPFSLLERPPHNELPERWNSKVTSIKEYVTVRGRDSIKKHLLNKGSLISPMHTIFDMYFYKSGVFSSFFNMKIGNHCLCCIGYDDEKEAWLIKNSWGNKWGEKGYAWIKYGSHNVDNVMFGISGFNSLYKEESEKSDQSLKTE